MTQRLRRAGSSTLPADVDDNGGVNVHVAVNDDDHVVINDDV